MTQILFVGLGFMAVAAFHLIPALRTGEIPSRWPVYPLTREAKPVQYQITFSVFIAIGFIGAVITIWALWGKL